MSTIGPKGATTAQVLQALSGTGVSYTGAGITVGVLSDSFNKLGTATQDAADGALPASMTWPNRHSLLIGLGRGRDWTARSWSLARNRKTRTSHSRLVRSIGQGAWSLVDLQK